MLYAHGGRHTRRDGAIVVAILLMNALGDTHAQSKSVQAYICKLVLQCAVLAGRARPLQIRLYLWEMTKHKNQYTMSFVGIAAIVSGPAESAYNHESF